MLDFLGTIFGALGHSAVQFTQSNAMAIGSTILSILGIWKVVEWAYKNYFRTFIKDVVSHGESWMDDKGEAIGRFQLRNVKQKSLRVEMFLDMESAKDRLSTAFLNGLARGSQIMDDQRVKEALLNAE